MPTRRVYRITTFVPPEHLDGLLAALERVAPQARFGRYEGWAWWSAPGVEQFRPLEGASPAVGEPGRVERVPSVRLEFTLPHDSELLETVLLPAVAEAHPWEEPVIFVDESLSLREED